MNNFWQQEQDSYESCLYVNNGMEDSSSGFGGPDPGPNLNPFRQPRMTTWDGTRHGVVHNAVNYPAINWGPTGFNQNPGPRINWTINQNFNMNGAPGSLTNWQSANSVYQMWSPNQMTNGDWNNQPPNFTSQTVRFVDPLLTNLASSTSNASSNEREERFAGRLGPPNQVRRDPSPKKRVPVPASTNLRQISLSPPPVRRQRQAAQGSVPSSSITSQGRTPSSTATVGSPPFIRCHLMSKQRYLIYTKDLPIGLDPCEITTKVTDSYHNTVKEVIHFGKNQFIKILEFLETLPSPWGLSLPSMDNGDRLPITHFPAELRRQLIDRGYDLGQISDPVPSIDKNPNLQGSGKDRAVTVSPSKPGGVAILIDLTDSPEPTTAAAQVPARSVHRIRPAEPIRTERSSSSRSSVTTAQLSSSSKSATTATTATTTVHSKEVPSSLTRSRLHYSRTALMAFKPDAWMNIPGYEIIEHLVNPYCLKKSTSGSGSCYKKFEVLLSTSRIEQLYERNSTLVVLLRLLLTKVGTKEVVDDKLKTLTIDEIDVNRSLVKISKTQGHRFNFDITSFVNGHRISYVGVSAKVDRRYEKELDILCYVSLARKADAGLMLEQLIIKPKIPKDRTQKMIADSLKEAAESGILLNESKLTVSLKCPLGKALITIPCRGLFCSHYTCFDGSNFLQLYAKYNNWVCPICDVSIDREDLIIDSFFQNILKSVKGNDDCKVEIDTQGEFSVKTRAIAEPAIVTESVEQTTVMVVSDEEEEDCSVEVPGIVNPGNQDKEDDEIEDTSSAALTTQTRPEDSAFAMYIPGFDIVEHLIATDHTIISKSGLGKYYKSSDFMLSPTQLRNISEPGSLLSVVLHWYLIESGLYSEGNNKLVIGEVIVNRESVQLTRKDGRRLDIDITPYLSGLAKNQFSISGGTDRTFRSIDLDIFCNVTIVRRPSVLESFKMLLAKPKIPRDQTRKLITDQLMDAIARGLLCNDSKLPVSLTCPIQKTQMEIPCRGINCEHFTCFDAMNCLETYAKVFDFPCPICYSILHPEDLSVDSYLQEILRFIPQKDGNENSMNYRALVDVKGMFSFARVTTRKDFEAVPPVEAETGTVPVEPEIQPSPVEPENEPSPVEPENEPSPVEPENEPSPVEPENEPSPVEPENEPSPVEPETEPSPVESETEPSPIEAETESSPVEPESELSTTAPVIEDEVEDEADDDEDDEIVGMFTQKQIQDNSELAILLDNHKNLKELRRKMKKVKRSAVNGCGHTVRRKKISQDALSLVNEWKALEAAEKSCTEGMEFILREPREIDYGLCYDFEENNFNPEGHHHERPVIISDNGTNLAEVRPDGQIATTTVENAPVVADNDTLVSLTSSVPVPSNRQGEPSNYTKGALPLERFSPKQIFRCGDHNTSVEIVENSPVVKNSPRISENLDRSPRQSTEEVDSLQGCSSANPLGRKLRSIIRTKRKLNFETNSDEKPSTSPNKSVSPFSGPACKKIAFSS